MDKININFARPSRKARLSGSVSLLISQPLAYCTLQDALGPHCIGYASLGAGVLPEIKLVAGTAITIHFPAERVLADRNVA